MVVAHKILVSAPDPFVPFGIGTALGLGLGLGLGGLELGLDNKTDKKLLNQLHREPVHENLKRSKETSIGLNTQREFTLVQKICNKKIIKTEVK